ncbi:MAG: hypothetical protein COA84_07000 [Robiginitomaculum sp.]|nr:MAG: hypothetical protein COA84_07000 [Robiginitomaculum sp.]
MHDAANIKQRPLATNIACHGNAGGEIDNINTGFNAQLFQLIATIGGDGYAHILNGLAALLRCDNNGVGNASAGFLRRGDGRCAKACHGHADKKEGSGIT